MRSETGTLKLSAWTELLPESDIKRDYLLSGIKEGFHIIDSVPKNISNVEVQNYKSATNSSCYPKVEAQILDELSNGQYITVPTKPRIVSAIGAIPKKNSNKIRLIHDCSRPTGSAVNDFSSHNPFKYQSLQDAVDLIQEGDFLAKVDLSNAYRVVKIHKDDFAATGLKWTFSGKNQPTYMIDTRLPFGASRSPEIFNELTQAVRRIMISRGYSQLVAYLDDFLVVGRNQQDCLQAMNELVYVLRRLGFRINYNKLEGPARRLTFLGLVLCTSSMTVSLPAEKMKDLRECLQNIKGKNKITKKCLQSLAGKLNWATQCIYGGRFHLRRILDKINSLKRPWHRARVTSGMKADLDWWLRFMDHFNGKTKMVDNRPAAPVCTDACNVAAGAYYMGQCLYTPWDSCLPKARNLHINYKEVLALEPAVKRWAPLWANKKIFVHIDNQAAVSIVNKGSSRDPIVMDSLRNIFWMSAVYNFRLKAVYYPGKFNIVADSISRFHEPNGYVRLLHALSTCI